MKKETKAYILNILKSEYFGIDLVNMLVGIAVLGMSVLAFITGSITDFFIVFILGALLATIHLFKSVKRKSPMGMVMFSGLTIAMFAMICIIYGYFLM